MRLNKLTFKGVVLFAFIFSSFSWGGSLQGKSSTICRSVFTRPNISATATDFSNAWRNEKIRSKMISFFKNGILKDAPAIAEKLISVTDQLVKENPNISDDMIYLEQRKIILKNWSEFQSAFHANDINRIKSRGEQIKMLLEHFVPRNYLDVGAGDGSIAFEMMQQWQLKRENVNGIEVATYPNRKDINWMSYESNGRIPIESGSIQIITLMMVLHHIDNPGRILAEIERILSHDGLLIVRETDAFNQNEQKLNQVLDTMFYRVFAENSTVPLPNKYKARNDWKTYIEGFGLELEKEVSFEPENPFSPVFLVFKKRATEVKQ